MSTYSSRSGDVWAALWSDRQGVLDLGTDAREWWADFDTLVSLFDAQADVRAGVSFHDDADIVAFQEGSVGWGVYAATAVHYGRVFPLRFTVIFHLEHGAWKVVHIHRSIGARNEEALGLNLPSATTSSARS